MARRKAPQLTPVNGAAMSVNGNGNHSQEVVPLSDPSIRPRNVTPKRIVKYIEKVLALYGPVVIPEAMECLRKAMAMGDIRAAEKMLESYGILKTGGGVVINNNNANISQANTYSRGFDAIIRQMRNVSQESAVEE